MVLNTTLTPGPIFVSGSKALLSNAKTCLFSCPVTVLSVSASNKRLDGTRWQLGGILWCLGLWRLRGVPSSPGEL